MAKAEWIICPFLCTTSGHVFFHFSACSSDRLNCMKHSASRSKTPSTDTTSGVNDARRASAVSLNFHFFSSSTDKIKADSCLNTMGRELKLSSVRGPVVSTIVRLPEI